MEEDFLYKNAPLVEVIAELQWEVVPVHTIPGGGLDPYAKILQERFSQWAGQNGFKHLDSLVPADMPPELLPHKPFIRLRRSAGSWPLYQLGPGLFTANIVPPYKGWGAFQQHLSDGVAALFQSYPAANELLKFSRLELRYIDAFQAKHGMRAFDEFATDQLRIRRPLPDAFLEKHAETARTQFETIFTCRNMPNCTGIISFSPGMSNGEESAILQLIVRDNNAPRAQCEEDIAAWYNSAHAVVSQWFDDLLTPQLKQAMGPRIPIKEA